MQLEVLQENLAKAITQAARFTNTKAQLPILGNILLSVRKTKILICSTNLEVSVATSVGAKVKEDGELSIPSRLISEVVNNLPKETVSLISEKEQLKISMSGFSSTILGMNTSDFPKIPTSIDKDKAIEISSKEFTEALSQVSFSVSSDETRPVLTGVLFTWKDKTLTLVSTDGFRLSQRKINLNKSNQFPQIILPKSVLSEIPRIPDLGNSIFLDLKEKDKQVLFEVSNVVLSSRLLEGDYPDYEKIIPKNSNFDALVDREEFLRSVKLASVFAKDAANIIKLKITNGNLEISSESGNSGNQSTKIDCKLTKNEAELKSFEISFNYRFIEEFLQSTTGDEIEMKFTSQNSPGIFSDTGNSNYLHLIMPVKTQD